VLVPVSVVEGVAMPVVHVVEVIAVFERLMPAFRAVLVVAVIRVVCVHLLALVPMPLVEMVNVPIVEVVDMIAVVDGGMSAFRSVLVGVVFVGRVGRGH
jgi:hypothetical protein